MLKALMEKVNNMKDQMENFSREMETIRKNQMEIWNENQLQRWRMPLIGLSVDDTAKERRWVNRNYPNWNTKRKKK